MTIDPRIAFWFGVWTFLLLGLANGSGHLPSTFSKETADQIISWAGFLAWINSGILTAASGYSSNRPGPMVSVPVKVVIIIAAVLTGLLALPSEASAQTAIRKPAITGNIPADIKTDLGIGDSGVKLTGNPEKDIQALWKRIVSASNADLKYASALAGSANTASSKIRQQCWDAIIVLNDQANGANLKNPDGTPMVKPDPSLFTNVESLAEVIDNLSPQGPLFTSCAGAAQLAKTNTLTFINAVVTGAAGIAALPAGL